MRAFCDKLSRPFHARYNPLNSTIWVDRKVKVQSTSRAGAGGGYAGAAP